MFFKKKEKPEPEPKEKSDKEIATDFYEAERAYEKAKAAYKEIIPRSYREEYFAIQNTDKFFSDIKFTEVKFLQSLFESSKEYLEQLLINLIRRNNLDVFLQKVEEQTLGIPCILDKGTKDHILYPYLEKFFDSIEKLNLLMYEDFRFHREENIVTSDDSFSRDPIFLKLQKQSELTLEVLKHFFKASRVWSEHIDKLEKDLRTRSNKEKDKYDTKKQLRKEITNEVQ